MLAGKMKGDVRGIIEAVTPVVAIVVIWRLVDAAVNAGLDGVRFFGGVAAIAGLGGYEIKEWVIRRRTKTTTEETDKEG